MGQGVDVWVGAVAWGGGGAEGEWADPVRGEGSARPEEGQRLTKPSSTHTPCTRSHSPSMKVGCSRGRHSCWCSDAPSGTPALGPVGTAPVLLLQLPPLLERGSTLAGKGREATMLLATDRGLE